LSIARPAASTGDFVRWTQSDPATQVALGPLHTQRTVRAPRLYRIDGGDPLFVAELHQKWRQNPIFNGPNKPFVLGMAAAMRPAFGGGSAAATTRLAWESLSAEMAEPSHHDTWRRNRAKRCHEINSEQKHGNRPDKTGMATERKHRLILLAKRGFSS
jgi:hypothetical protein